MNHTDYISILRSCSNTLKENYGIKSLRIFGSFARNMQKETSDIDVFVDTETADPFILMDAKDYLEQLFGRSVDIVRNHKNLNPFLKNRINHEGILVF